MENTFILLCESLSDVIKLCSIPSDKFVLYTDACAAGLGAVLCIFRDREERTVAVGSRQLLKAEYNYSAFELEATAII